MFSVALPFFVVFEHPEGHRCLAPSRPVRSRTTSRSSWRRWRASGRRSRALPCTSSAGSTRRRRRPPASGSPACCRFLAYGIQRHRPGPRILPVRADAADQPGVPGLSPDDQPGGPVHPDRVARGRCSSSGSGASDETRWVLWIFVVSIFLTELATPPAGGRPRSAGSRGSSGTCCGPSRPSRPS